MKTDPNRGLLFGTVQPFVWKSAWNNLHSDDEAQRAAGLFFWLGIYSAAEASDLFIDEKRTLAFVALGIAVDKES